LRRADADDRELRRQLDDVRLLSGLKAPALEAEVADLLARHRADYRDRFLEAGAAVRLLVAGDLPQVLPLDDAALLDAARPVLPDGKVRADPEPVRAREDAQVRAALAAGPCALIVLGGGYDLSDSVRRLVKGRCDVDQPYCLLCQGCLGLHSREIPQLVTEYTGLFRRLGTCHTLYRAA
jgi:hypothetical protein